MVNIPLELYNCLLSPTCRPTLFPALLEVSMNIAFLGTILIILVSPVLGFTFWVASRKDTPDETPLSAYEPFGIFKPSRVSEPSASPSTTNILPPPSPVLIASDHHHDNRPHLLLSCTGSVATIKLPLILSYLSSTHPNLSIRLILSQTSLSFLRGQSAENPTPRTLLDTIPTLEAIYLDSDEWLRPWVRGDPILHIELRRWADLMVIAPLSANAMAGLCAGFSDSLILSVARAWDGTGTIDVEREGVEWPYPARYPPLSTGRDDGGRKKGIIVCPAMNTAMWNHFATREHMAKLEGEWNVRNEGGWVEVLRPVEKNLACGDVGSGAMREWREICGVVEERLGLKREMTEGK
ncbi:hypothetical protein TI39_contig851g00008 [Zymoseptoria brevis]|uniref:Flavoprotein domain-containing protein n=1 Tax=Zymoseptoria brevis TaxID=1047168 RepID=A0A0F4GG59_9PEZI|nr:hypothetical protein TI39_contig851g00008 [Zymoseptoria brevis]